jgi:hypothetical protein
MRWVPALLLVTACTAGTTGATGTPTVTPSPAPAPTITTTPTATPSPTKPTPVWVVGASPLPLRADGFGEVLPTPTVLRDRHLQAADILPPPSDGRFHTTAVGISSATRERMGTTYKAGCPTPLSALRYVTLTFRGFDGRAHTGELVLRKDAVPRAVAAFRRRKCGFPAPRT